MKKYLAEMIGTAVLVLMWCGAAVLAGGDIGLLWISLAFGLAVLVMVYTIGPISGCHINPAISIAMWVHGKLKTKDTVMYVIFQLIGWVVGAAILYYIASGNPHFDIANGLAANGFWVASPGGYGLVSVIVTEIVMTALFLLVIFWATDKKAPEWFAGIAIGLALTLIHLVSINVSNTSVNPARSFGPALFSGGVAMSQLWVFFLAPIVGGILWAYIWKLIKAK